MIWKELISFHGKSLTRGVQYGLRNFSLSRVFSKDHYETLGVKRDATQTEIKNAYFELSKIYHPDRIEATDKNLEMFRDISAAYEVLGNEQSRRLYDRGLVRDDKGIGIDVPQDPKDPIIQFYKQRHERSKMSLKHPEQNMDEWTRELYGKARQEKHKKNEYFQEKKHAPDDYNYLTDSNNCIAIVCFVIAIIIASHFENHPVRNFMLKTFSFDD